MMTYANKATRKMRYAQTRKAGLALVFIAPALLLGGCASHDRDHFVVGSTSHNYKERHPIIIGENEKTLDIPVGRASYALPVASASAVEGFARAYRRSANGAVTIMTPEGSPNAAAAGRVAVKVARVLTRSGVPGSRIRYQKYGASGHGNSAPIRLSFHAITAKVTGCGQWPDDLAADINRNRHYHNYGCASQSNLAAIVANPADLLGPRGTASIDATRRAKVIEDYRDGDIDIEQEPTRVFSPAG